MKCTWHLKLSLFIQTSESMSDGQLMHVSYVPWQQYHHNYPVYMGHESVFLSRSGLGMALSSPERCRNVALWCSKGPNIIQISSTFSDGERDRQLPPMNLHELSCFHLCILAIAKPRQELGCFFFSPVSRHLLIEGHSTTQTWLIL